MRYVMSSFLLLLAIGEGLDAHAREWHDATNNYTLEADLIASTDDQVVLKRKDGKLVAIEKSKFSEADQKYLESKVAAEQSGDSDLQTWTMKSGLKVVGRLVGYGRKEVVIQRRRGKIFVNDRLFNNLPEIYQHMLPRIVAHFEGIKLANDKELLLWTLKQNGQPRKFVCDGVMLELENGDEYAVPFIFFSEDDLKVLQPGWEDWLANYDDAVRRQQEDFMLRAQAAAYQRDHLANQQIAAMQMLLTAVDQGVTDVWEVYLQPKPGVRGRPQVVVVFARDSREAVATALRKNPRYIAGPVRKAN